MRRKHLKRVLALLTALTVAIGLTVPAAYAASGFDSYNTGTIEVNIGGKVPAKEKITVNLYKVATAEVGENGYIKYTKTEPFDPSSFDQDYDSKVPDVDPDVNPENYKKNKYGVGNVSLASTTGDKWIARAKTLAGYTKKDGFNDRAKATGNYWVDETNANSSAKFGFGEKLEKGLYLITVDPVTSGGKTYTFAPVLRCLPSLDENNEWNPNQKINYPSSKIEEKSNGGGGGGDSPKSISIKVRKDWKDEGQKSDRPESVTVELLRNGTPYGGTKKLDESVGWKAKWDNLPSSGTYVVNEISISDKYTVLVNQEGNTWVITNTHTTDIDDPDTPLDPGPGGDPGTGGDIPPTNIDDPDVPLDPGQTPGGSATNIQDPANAAKLPQTGQLWWPVPILAAAGIAFFSIGWLRSRKDESEENK